MALTAEIIAEKFVARPTYSGGFFDDALIFGIEKNRDGKLIRYAPDLALYGPSQEELELLGIIFPGHIASFPHSEGDKVNQNWASRMRSGISCYNFAEWISPHLYYKKEQAGIFKNFLYQKREVRKVREGLKRVPNYPSPQDRMEVENDWLEQLLQAKAVVTKASHVPEPERLAGFFDATAHLGIYRTDRTNSHKHQPEYQAAASITSPQTGLLEGLYDQYGGTKPIKVSDNIGRYNGPAYAWQIGGEGLKKLLGDIEPYLIFKQTKAQLVLDFFEVRQALHRPAHGAHRRPVFSSNPIITEVRDQTLQFYVNQFREL